MNNEPTDLAVDHAEQEAREQQVWERLQNEALAAQRWRLEQERQQARDNSAEAGTEQASMTAKQQRASRLTIAAVVSFIVITLLGTIVYAL